MTRRRTHREDEHEDLRLAARSPEPNHNGSWFVLPFDERGRRSILEITLRGEPVDILAREKNVDHFYRVAAAALARVEPGLLTDIKVVSSRPGTAVRAAFEAAAKRQPLTRLELPETRL